MANETMEELQKMAEELSDDELSQAVGGDMMDEARALLEEWRREHNIEIPKSRIDEMEEIAKKVSEERRKYYGDSPLDIPKR